MRSILGWQGYSYLTGATRESEIARVKNWDIALDAQLGCGDSHTCTRRLLLTFLASTPTTAYAEITTRANDFLDYHKHKTWAPARHSVYCKRPLLITSGETQAYCRRACKTQHPRSNDTAEFLAVPDPRWSLMNQAPQAVFADSIVIRIVQVARNEP